MPGSTVHTVGEPQRLGAKPVLRWAGSKRKQLARLRTFWSADHVRYVEPFVGSACLFFELAPTSAILGDTNAQLVEFYTVLRTDPRRLHRRLAHIPRDVASYYKWREMVPARLDKETRALRFLYLNRNCFNGIYRTNVKGEFNVPFGKKVGAYPTAIDFARCADLLKHVKLVAQDFEKTLEGVGSGDFVYLDPPYALDSRRVFRQYGPGSFKTTDVARLGKSLKRAHARGAHFLVSYADCTASRVLAREWVSVRLPIQRHVAGFADERRRAYEWLISNQPIPSGVGSKTPKRTEPRA